jgi:thiol-disulfide isomerase/thioredoxin
MSNPICFLVAALSLSQASGPPPTRDSLKAKALDSEILKKEASRTMGCLVTESGTNKEQFQTRYRTPDGRTGAALSSLVVDTQVIPADERAPKHFPPGSRVSAVLFKINRQDGTSMSVGDFKGQPVIVFIFKPDCQYTAEMLNEIIALSTLEEKARVKVLPVSISDGAWADIARYRQQNVNAIPKTFPIFRPSAEAGAGISVFKDLRVTPTTYILDREGNVAWRITGGVRGSLQDKVNHIRTEVISSNSPAPAPSGLP